MEYLPTMANKKRQGYAKDTYLLVAPLPVPQDCLLQFLYIVGYVLEADSTEIIIIDPFVTRVF